MKKRQEHTTVLATTAVIAAGISLWLGPGPSSVAAEVPQAYLARQGAVTLEFDTRALEALGWRINTKGSKAESDTQGQGITFTVRSSSTFRVEPIEDARGQNIVGALHTFGGLLLTGVGDRVVLGNLTIEVSADGRWTVSSPIGVPNHSQVVFELTSLMTDHWDTGRNLQVIGELSIAKRWADQLGRPETAGIVVGVISADLSMVPAGEIQIAEEVERQIQPEADGETAGVTGPDIVIGSLQSVHRYGRIGDITAYAIGTSACNIGDERASWISYTNEHPVISQSMYRLMDGRFEQIGLSWVKHGFYAVSQSLCTPCNDPTDGTELGVGCSDPYSAQLNGVQSNMSLRSDVDAHTGYYPYPWSAPPALTLIDKRVQVHDADIDPDLNDGAVYFIQGHYVTADDAASRNDNNNASYRSVLVSEPSPDFYSVGPTGQTQRGESAIRAWQDNDPPVVETDAQVSGGGLFIVSAKASDLGGGLWHYEYAVQNLNSDRGGQSFSVPIPEGTVVSNVGFHDVDYHSGEIYDLTDWAHSVAPGSITWETESYDVNPNANALRWGTIYNFRFDANALPDATEVTLGLFKPGVPTEVLVPTVGPVTAPADCNGNGIPDECDLDCGPPLGPCDVPGCGGSADGNADGIPDDCGACCAEDSCSQTTEAACESLGEYHGDTTSCEEGACADIPTVSEWGLIAMTLLVLSAGAVVLRRRQTGPA